MVAFGASARLGDMRKHKVEMSREVESASKHAGVDGKANAKRPCRSRGGGWIAVRSRVPSHHASVAVGMMSVKGRSSSIAPNTCPNNLYATAVVGHDSTRQCTREIQQLWGVGLDFCTVVFVDQLYHGSEVIVTGKSECRFVSVIPRGQEQGEKCTVSSKIVTMQVSRARRRGAATFNQCGEK